MNKIIFISYYTKNTIYEKIKNNYLLPSLQKWDLLYFIFPIESKKTWANNACLKPMVIQEAMEKFPEYDLVWEDVDSKIMKYPHLLFQIPEQYDIGLNYLNWWEHYGREGDEGITEMLDGTFFLRNNEKMRNFISEWKEKTTDQNINHQRPLDHMLKARKDINIFELPREYSYISDKPDGSLPAIPLKDPVIIHYQASRTAKKGLK